MNMMLLLVIYAVAIVGYVVFSRRRQAKAQEDRLQVSLRVRKSKQLVV